MADLPRRQEGRSPALASASAWAGIVEAGRTGRPDGQAGIVATLRDGLGLATVAVAPGSSDAVAARLAADRVDGAGIALPGPCRSSETNELCLIWTAPGQWLALTPARSGIERLAERLGGEAAIADQSDGRAILRLRGHATLEALAKGCMLDLHPRAFGAGAAASTIIGHVPALLWLSAGAGFLPDGFHLAVPRSIAGSFWSWLSASAAEFGLLVETDDGLEPG